MKQARWLLTEIPGFYGQNQAYIAASLAAAYPESAQYTLRELAEFYAVASYLDGMSLRAIRSNLGERRIRIPPLIQDDPYRICRYLMSRWMEQDFRQALLTIPAIPEPRLVALARRNDPAEMARLLATDTPFTGLWLLIRAGLEERIADAVALLSPKEQERYGHVITAGRAHMYRLINEPFLLRTLTMQERRGLIRRIRGRALRMRSMRRSIYALDQERRAVVAQARQAERAAMAELDHLAAELTRLQERLAEAERLHAEALARESSHFARQMAALQSERSALEHEFALALAERSAWAPCQFLQGLTVAVVGDEGRAASYASLIQSAGGRFHQVSALEKLNRIPEAVAGADVIILITAHAKHAAEHRLRKAASPRALFLRSPKAGVAALERLLQEEVLPRLLSGGQVAAGGDPLE